MRWYEIVCEFNIRADNQEKPKLGKGSFKAQIK